MAVSILEGLQCAEMNIANARHVPGILSLAQAQLHNAIVLLEKGYSLDTPIEPLLEKYESVENVPPNKKED